uniref:Macaca fascicularis brain cDNA clone: QtrA-15562, similar to human protein tyrosine phosphatase, receptor type, E (PTPRE),transcript variant 1, mRNA, RefSeq: NM_006504.3 n=1 Tax=Macaca fascicularis TaxID=9541 RepID=I7GEI6_MACFA|nr:unnamed protein product [Macaca fascicularis]
MCSSLLLCTMIQHLGGRGKWSFLRFTRSLLFSSLKFQTQSLFLTEGEEREVSFCSAPEPRNSQLATMKVTFLWSFI